MKTFRRATALVATALLATSLAACSHNNPSNDKESASAQATDSASTGKATQGDQPTTVAAQPAPDGYQTVTAPTTNLSFAVPGDWEVLTGDDLKDDQKIEEIANRSGSDPDQIRQLLSGLELQATATQPDDNNFAENTNVAPVQGVTALPTEDVMAQQIKLQGGTPGEYSTSQTSLGEVAIQTYTISAQGGERQGAVIAAPTKNGGWAAITVTTTDASRTQELTDTITSTLS